MKVNARPKSLFIFNSHLNRVQLPLDDIVKPHPSPEVEFYLWENYRSRAGLGINA
jgi:hypothetical protein